MDMRKLAAIALIAVALAVTVPAISSEDPEGASAEDVIINIQGGGSSIDLDLDSYDSATVEVYITNNSSSYLNVSVSGPGFEVVSFSSTGSILGSSGSLLYPTYDEQGNVIEHDGRNIAIVELTFTVDELADTQTVSGEVTFTFTEVGEAADTNVFTETIPVSIDIRSVFMSDSAYNKFFGVFPNTLPAPLNDPVVTAVVTLVLWILATILVCEIVIPLVLRLFKSNRNPKERKKITNALTKTISVMMLVIAANECLNIVGCGAEVMSTVARLSLVLYVVIGAVMAWQIYNFIIARVITGIDEGLDVDGIDASLIPLFRMIGKLVICVAAATLILAAYGVDLAGIMVSAGVITLGITFGAQQLISQFFSGIVLLATRPFRKGDYVSLNGTSYVVRKVKLMYTEFQNWDKDQVVTMPNNVVSAATLVNFSKGDSNTRVYIYVVLPYGSNLTLAKELMVQAANMHPHVVKDKSVSPPGTRMMQFLDYGVEYRLAAYVDDYDNNSHYAGQIREIMYKLFMDNGIQVSSKKLKVDVQDCDGRRRDYDPGDDE